MPRAPSGQSALTIRALPLLLGWLMVCILASTPGMCFYPEAEEAKALRVVGIIFASFLALAALGYLVDPELERTATEARWKTPVPTTSKATSLVIFRIFMMVACVMLPVMVANVDRTKYGDLGVALCLFGALCTWAHTSCNLKAPRLLLHSVILWVLLNTLIAAVGTTVLGPLLAVVMVAPLALVTAVDLNVFRKHVEEPPHEVLPFILCLAGKNCAAVCKGWLDAIGRAPVILRRPLTFEVIRDGVDGMKWVGWRDGDTPATSTAMGMQMGTNDELLRCVLLRACILGSMEWVKWLTDPVRAGEYYVNPDFMLGATSPMKCVAENGHHELCKLLLTLGVRQDDGGGDIRSAPLVVAVACGHAAVAFELTNPNGPASENAAPTNVREEALRTAVVCWNVDICRLLLENGLRADLPGPFGDGEGLLSLVLHDTADPSSLEICRLLMDSDGPAGMFAARCIAGDGSMEMFMEILTSLENNTPMRWAESPEKVKITTRMCILCMEHGARDEDRTELQNMQALAWLKTLV